MSKELSAVNAKVLSSVFLLLAAAAQFVWLYFDRQFSLSVALLDSFGSYATLYALFIFIDYGLHYYLPTPMRFLIVVLQSLIIAVIWVLLCGWSFLYIYIRNTGYVAFWHETVYIRTFIGWILLSYFTIITYLAKRIEKEDEERIQVQQNEKMRKEAELFKLRQQLHPHFLFNSLNSINALIGKAPQQARNMVQQLADLLRHTLKKEDDDAILFKDELDDLRLYLSIEQLRFGHRLVIEEDIDEGCFEKYIPPFLLQPLVENAIKFGLYGTIGKVVIHIQANVQKDGFLIFRISNPYDATAVSPKGTGFGLESVQRRLYLLFARNDLLYVEKVKCPSDEDDTDYFTASIRIPV